MLEFKTSGQQRNTLNIGERSRSILSCMMMKDSNIKRMKTTALQRTVLQQTLNDQVALGRTGALKRSNDEMGGVEFARRFTLFL